MKKVDVIAAILGERKHYLPIDTAVTVFAPTNIALCKYWGKRDQELNLPMTSSLSISLDDKGATTQLQRSTDAYDKVTLNNQVMDLSTPFCQRLFQFLNLFRKPNEWVDITITTNIPIAAGLASSAAGFASIIKALNEWYQWDLSLKELSILARLGSGSACRSLWNGFVEWQAGEQCDGMDSHGELFHQHWPELCVDIRLTSSKEKTISSREAMQRTIETSPAYQDWPARVKEDLSLIKQAIREKDFILLGKTAEANALMMHATMLTARPAIQYSTAETIAMMQQIWHLRAQGLNVYFTQDAGPNLKLLYLAQDRSVVNACHPSLRSTTVR